MFNYTSIVKTFDYQYIAQEGQNHISSCSPSFIFFNLHDKSDLTLADLAKSGDYLTAYIDTRLIVFDLSGEKLRVVKDI